MKLFYHPDQERHAPPYFFRRGALSESPDGPQRTELLKQGVAEGGFTLTEPTEVDSPRLRERLKEIHTERYLEFLETIYRRWHDLSDGSDVVAPSVHPTASGKHYPRHPAGQVGWHLHDMACPMVADSFHGILASAATAQAAAESIVDGGGSAYALCRPPGHHAGPDRAGGYCFINNAALAAVVLREKFSQVAILDIDLHHGNGTQEIFYDRGDVWTGSLHADPSDFYPFYWGTAEEQGMGPGDRANVNIPLPVGSGGEVFQSGIDHLIDAMASFSPDALVVSLGFNAHKDDPLAGMGLETQDFVAIGRQIGELGLPTVLVQEGGYPTPALSHNLAAFLRGFTDV
ncbi:histone deacetylase family protein [Halomonas cupida]|uniref:Acetoin utilization deacetylase AcuC n=1 Tax=Halomonas cupida TaxID=44933 RepID=A0A1M7LY45_9GAMM|nr:histone deacetylase family protein [Halomonas cupida]GEN25833.1 acetylpolyamine amidohydrolase [Halomonas cupida]SHM83189.1 Acetoin utilization deacetylase AcuC [Halomonas cupida]